jgi:CRISPR-associated protein Csm2
MTGGKQTIMGDRNFQQSKGGGPQPQVAASWSKILFWQDKQAQRIDPRLFSKTAEEMALRIGDENSRQSKLNKRTQIRKFYDEVLRLNGLAQSSDVPFDSVLPQVHMLVAKTAYAKGRELVSPNFLTFIKESVEQVKTKDDLRVFADFFEAFMGFYRIYGPNN